MRTGTCAVLVMFVLAGCGNKDDAVQTTPPPATATPPAAAAPAPAPTAPAAPAAGRQGGAAAAMTVAEHSATMKVIAQNVQAAVGVIGASPAPHPPHPPTTVRNRGA